MPTGLKGQNLPASVISSAVKVAEISPGEIEDDGKDPAAKALGAKGGAARAKAMTAEQRAAIARMAASARWKKK